MYKSFFKILVALVFAIFAQISFSATPKIMLGIDVLEADNFAQLKGKRVGLLTHPAGVNRYGVSTIDVLRRAKNVKLVALFGPEHGIYGNEKADVPVLDKIDKKTSLPVYSLYGKYRKPNAQMLSKIDVMVIDLQDVGSRSYTYISCMLRAMEACFEAGKEVIVLDRPNPLGGLKVCGPILDMEYKSYVGMFKTPYLHGLTIGELALFAKHTKGAMEITSSQQAKGKLKVIKMRGWNRNMLFVDTGLTWRATSPAIPSFAAATGYAMTGLGCQVGGFQHGYGTKYPFRYLTFPNKTGKQIKAALDAKKIRGVIFQASPIEHNSKKLDGVYVVVSDWNSLRPTELSFYLMEIACEFRGDNPFKTLEESTASLYNKHTGSKEWYNHIYRHGGNVNVNSFVNKWNAEALLWQKNAKKFWLY